MEKGNTQFIQFAHWWRDRQNSWHVHGHMAISSWRQRMIQLSNRTLRVRQKDWNSFISRSTANSCTVDRTECDHSIDKNVTLICKQPHLKKRISIKTWIAARRFATGENNEPENPGKAKPGINGHNEGSIRPTPKWHLAGMGNLKSGKRLSKTLLTKPEARD